MNVTSNSVTGTDSVPLLNKTGSPLTGYREFQMSIWVRIGCLILLMPLSTVGNGLAFVVLCRKALRHSATSVLLRALAIVDLAAMYCACLPENIAKTAGKYLESTSDFMCKAYFFNRLTIVTASSWILVLLSIERAIALWFPLRMKIVCSKRNAAIALVLTLLVVILINARYFFIRGMYGRDCLPHPQFVGFEYTVSPWIVRATFYMIPVSFLLFFNSLVIVKLQLLKFTRSESQQAKITNGTIVMLLATVCYIVFVSPVIIFYMVYPDWNIMGDRDKAKLELQLAIFQSWSYVNNTINFLIYVTSGQRFRRELLKLRKIWKLNVVEPSSTNGHSVTDVDTR